jgi:hypothetical protein
MPASRGGARGASATAARSSPSTGASPSGGVDDLDDFFNDTPAPVKSAPARGGAARGASTAAARGGAATKPATPVRAVTDDLDFLDDAFDSEPSKPAPAARGGGAAGRGAGRGALSSSTSASATSADADEKKAAAAAARYALSSLSLSLSLSACMCHAQSLRRERAAVARQRAMERRAPGAGSGSGSKGDDELTPLDDEPVKAAPARSVSAKSPTPVSPRNNQTSAASDIDVLDDIFGDVDAKPAPSKSAPVRAAPVAAAAAHSIKTASAAPTRAAPKAAISKPPLSPKRAADDDIDDAGDSTPGDGGGAIDLNNVRGTTVLRIYLKKDDTYKTLGVNANATGESVIVRSHLSHVWFVQLEKFGMTTQ